MSARKKRRKWNRTPRRYAIIALIAAVIGIALDCAAVLHYSDDADYSEALVVTNAEEAAELEGYTGKVVLQGPLKGTTFTFQEAYGNTEMAKDADAEGNFLYTQLVLTRPEEYVSNQREVDTQGALPEYDVRSRHYRYDEQADDLNLYGVPIQLEGYGCVGLTDYGTLYTALTERAELKGVEGPEVPAAVIGTMENGELVTESVYVNGSVEEAVKDASNSLMVFHVLLAVWLLACGFVIFSMYLQRYR